MPEGLEVSDFKAQVPLQSLLEKTVRRWLLVESNKEMVDRIRDENNGSAKLELLWRWGFDGTGSQAVYHMANESGDATKKETTLFATQMTPINVKHLGNGDVIWKNRRANCACTCRPIRLCYEKEDKESIQAEYNRMIDEIEALKDFEPIPGVRFSFADIKTAFDGKCLTYILDEPSSQNCPLCSATPKQMSTPGTEFKLKDMPNILDHGFGSLHVRLRAAVCVLNMGKRSRIKKHFTKLTQRDHLSMARREDEIKEYLWQHLSVRVGDVGGETGTSLTGNVARKLFGNPRVFAEACEVPEELVKQLAIICNAIACRYELDPVKFELACSKFMDIYYGFFLKPNQTTAWFKLPQTVHKVIAHGRQLLENLPCPPGLASEESPEANNKNLREFRKSFARKSKRSYTMYDVMQRLLVRSDPYILSFSEEKALKKAIILPIEPEIQAMLKTTQEHDDLVNEPEDEAIEDEVIDLEPLAEEPLDEEPLDEEPMDED